MTYRTAAKETLCEMPDSVEHFRRGDLSESAA